METNREKNGDDFKVVVLCGSTQYKKEHEEFQKQLTLEGNIVIPIAPFWREEQRELHPMVIEMFQEMHFAKIDMADAIAVVNPNGYIGTDTAAEIEYAKAHNKQIWYMCNQIGENYENEI